MAFKGHFSRQAADYRRYRPTYPAALIDFVASRCVDRRVAVDCATGSGQAAVALAGRFAAVIAVDGSVDLVAAAQAAHWFDHDRFHAECRRVLAPGGADWPPERHFVAEGYRTLPFPWGEEPAPPFAIEVDWDLAQLMGYLATWSAVQRFRDRTGQDPLAALQPRLAQSWPQGRARRVLWPVNLRLGRA
jgi:ubiquinone/menaquinone biosynthesis C-methylase UbiE